MYVCMYVFIKLDNSTILILSLHFNDGCRSMSITLRTLYPKFSYHSKFSNNKQNNIITMLTKKFIIKIASHFLTSLWYYFLHRSTHFTAGVTFENAQVSDITSVKGLSAFGLGELFVLPQTFG